MDGKLKILGGKKIIIIIEGHRFLLQLTVHASLVFFKIFSLNANKSQMVPQCHSQHSGCVMLPRRAI